MIAYLKSWAAKVWADRASIARDVVLASVAAAYGAYQGMEASGTFEVSSAVAIAIGYAALRVGAAVLVRLVRARA